MTRRKDTLGSLAGCKLQSEGTFYFTFGVLGAKRVIDEVPLGLSLSYPIT
jgi:hypothetical protein